MGYRVVKYHTKIFKRLVEPGPWARVGEEKGVFLFNKKREKKKN